PLSCRTSRALARGEAARLHLIAVLSYFMFSRCSPRQHLGGDRGPHTRRIAECGSPRRHIAGDHAACSDYRIITDGNARQDDRSRSDPDVASDADRAAKLQSGGASRRVARMIGSQDLHPRPDLRTVADGDLHYIEDYAVKVQENASTEPNVEAVH